MEYTMMRKKGKFRGLFVAVKDAKPRAPIELCQVRELVIGKCPFQVIPGKHDGTHEAQSQEIQRFEMSF